MNDTSSTPVASLTELISALSSGGPRTIELTTSVACPHSITLPPGFSLVREELGSERISELE